MDFGGFGSAEIVPVAFAPLTITLDKGFFAEAPYTVCMPERRSKVHPLLTAVLTDRAVKESVYTGICLIQKSNEIVFQGCLVSGI